MARKENNIHYIYKTTCNVTGRWYVGMHSTSNIDDGYLGSGLRLRRSIRKYGKENHIKEILEYFETRELLVLREIEILNQELIEEPMCMNLMCGGQGGFISDEHYQKIGKMGGAVHANRMKNNIEYREKSIKHSIINLKNIEKSKITFDNFKGKNHTEESKLKISKTRKETNVCAGSNNSQYGTCWITRDGVNKKIKKSDYEEYSDNGWVKGQIRKSKIDYDILLEIKKIYESGTTYLELSKIYSIPKTTIIDNIKKYLIE